MTIILDEARALTSPPSMMLFDDTSHKSIHYAPREWRLDKINGQDAIQYNEWPKDDIAFLQIILAPFVNVDELIQLKVDARQLGLAVQPVRYLGKDSEGRSGSKITVPFSFPDNANFRFVVNGGQGGSFGNPIPLVFSTNLRVGRMLKDMIHDTSRSIGLAFQFAAMLRGATTSFQAVVIVDYERTYEILSLRHSWKWWVWSGDIQSAWQELTVKGAITIETLGGTADQKTIAYKMGEWLRDMFFKPELGSVTQPDHPDTGIINTSLRYERQHERKKFRVEFNEREFAESPYTTAASTGTHILDGSAIQSDTSDMGHELLKSVMGAARPVYYDEIPSSLEAATRSYWRHIIHDGKPSNTADRR